MREIFGTSRQRLRTPAVAAVVVAMLLGLFATTAHAVPRSADRASESARAGTSATVLKNEFGKVRSRIVGTFGRSGTFVGEFKPRRFKEAGGQLVAVGKLRGDLVRGNGNVRDTVNERVKIPVATVQGQTPLGLPALRATCPILNLVLAPLDLDLLGLQVHLDRVVLRIVAESGAGNLLGNLLCAVAGLLDGPGLLAQISQILTSILAILRL